MQIHSLHNPAPRKRHRRVGRGGKKGTYSGRGLKGQRSRSGARIRPAIRDFIKTVPKKRGYRFGSIAPKVAVINLGVLSKVSEAGDTVNITYLRKKGLVGRQKRVKILGDGTLTHELNFKGCLFSARAAEAVRKRGGKIS